MDLSSVPSTRHRLSNLRHADRIIVLDEGQIVQDGTHDDLLKEDGLYRSMFEKQASFYRQPR